MDIVSGPSYIETLKLVYAKLDHVHRFLREERGRVFNNNQARTGCFIRECHGDSLFTPTHNVRHPTGESETVHDSCTSIEIPRGRTGGSGLDSHCPDTSSTTE